MLLLVLNDSETYSDVAGCRIVELPDDIDPDSIEGVLRHQDDEEGYKLVEQIDDRFLEIEAIDPVTRAVLAVVADRTDLTEEEITKLYNEIEDAHPSALYASCIACAPDALEDALIARKEGNELEAE